MSISLEEYRKRDAQSMAELELVNYYITDYFSYAEVPDDAYRIRFKNIIKESTELSDEAKEYILKKCRSVT